MSIGMVVILLIINVTLLIGLIFLGWRFFYDERKYRGKAPYVGSYRSHKKLLLKNCNKIQGKSIIDIGCGDGGMMRFFISKLGYNRAVGYEIRWFPILLGNIKNWINRHKEVIIEKKDFTKVTLQHVDTIYLFLLESEIVLLEKRIHDSIRHGTVVITNTFHFPNWKPFDTIENQKGKTVFHLYKKT